MAKLQIKIKYGVTVRYLELCDVELSLDKLVTMAQRLLTLPPAATVLKWLDAGILNCFFVYMYFSLVP